MSEKKQPFTPKQIEENRKIARQVVTEMLEERDREIRTASESAVPE